MDGEIKKIEHDERNCEHVPYPDIKQFLLMEINAPIIKSVEFCINILSRNKQGMFLHMDRFKSYSDIAANEIKLLVNSPNDLMKVLRKFPLVFGVTGNKVCLRNWIIFYLNQQEWLKELVANPFRLVPIYISTIQFYCNELFKIVPRFELSICQLFSHKRKAPEAIQAITRNVEEFELFLQMHPEIFQLDCDNVKLTESAVAYRSLETWIRRLLVGDLTMAKHMKEDESSADGTLSGMMFYEVLKNEVVAYDAVGFHHSIILNSDSIKGLSLRELFSQNNGMVQRLMFIKNIVDFEMFITSYPEVFTLINETVFLTEHYTSIGHNELISERKDQLNCSESKENGSDQENSDQAVISFYQGILHNICSLPCKITEFPINLLVCYNVMASPEIRKIAKNAEELKNFLSQYPQIFKINSSDNIVFGKTDDSLGFNENSSDTSIDSNVINERIFEDKLKEGVSFYNNIIYDLGGTAEIEQLLDYRWQTNKEVQRITTNFEELKNFFRSQENDFSVINDRVCLKNKEKGDVEINTHNNFAKPDAIKNAISFYSNVLRKYKSCSLNRMSGHRGSAPDDVRSVAKNPKELKTFFSQFPEVFSIVQNNIVMLSKPFEKMVIMEQQQIPQEMSCCDSENDAVEFFSKMLSNYGICGVLSINKLFELKLSSSPAIQKMSGSNINQFLAFLRKYPQEFLITNDNVIARKKIPKWSYSEKYENKKFTDPVLLLIFNFFKMYTSNKSLFHINHLYNNVGKFFLYNDETPVFPSRSDLLLFLGLYPHIFFVDYSRIVNVIASGKKAFISAFEKRKHRSNNQNIARNKKRDIPKPPTVPSPKSPLSDVETKAANVGMEEKISNNVKTIKKGAIKHIPSKQPTKGLGKRTRNKRKNNVPVLEPSFSEESLVSELSKKCDENKEFEFNSSNAPELGNHFKNNECSPSLGNGHEGEYNPPKIEEIENNVISHFIGKANNTYNISKNIENFTLSHNVKILNHSFSNTVSSCFPKDFSEREDFDVLITEALMFLNSKLWEEGKLRIMEIEELFNSFSQSMLVISNCFCKNVKEFKDFLCKFPDQFIIAQNKVMARKNKIEKISYLLDYKEESLPITLFHFLNLYTKHFNFILLKHLHSQVGKYFCNVNRSPFFKTLGDLALFLEMFPTVFCIENNQIKNLTASKENVYCQLLRKFNSGVIKIDSFLDEKLFSMIINEEPSSILESTEGWKNYVLERTQIIEDLRQCQVITAEILNSQKVIFLDCEGVNLGAAGILTLLQIGVVNGQVYIFDIVKERSMVNDGGLKDILESESILKVIHDSKNDVANLYTEYAVEIRQIFDTRVVHHLIVNQGVSSKKMSNRLTAIGFNELCSKYGAYLNVQKDEMKDVYKYNQSYWMNRPLTKNMLAYAALDVASLPKVFYTMLKQLKGIPERSLWELSGQHSLSVLSNRDLLFD